MLSQQSSYAVERAAKSRQRGVVLIIVLIVLVAMTMAAVSLMRSGNTAMLVAGNMAFRQAAIRAGDIGTETAITWLQTNSAGTTLYKNIPTSGYFAIEQNPAPGQTWDDFWKTQLDPSPASRPVSAAINSGSVMTLPTDTGASLSTMTSGSGTTISYVIHRLCTAQTSPTTSGTYCASSPTSTTTSGNSKTAGYVPLKYNNQVYYRITSRIEGPRNTVSYVQSIIAM